MLCGRGTVSMHCCVLWHTLDSVCSVACSQAKVVLRMQLEATTRESAMQRQLLRYLQLQPEAAAMTPALVNLEALKTAVSMSPAPGSAGLHSSGQQGAGAAGGVCAGPLGGQQGVGGAMGGSAAWADSMPASPARKRQRVELRTHSQAPLHSFTAEVGFRAWHCSPAPDAYPAHAVHACS